MTDSFTGSKRVMGLGKTGQTAEWLKRRPKVADGDAQGGAMCGWHLVQGDRAGMLTRQQLEINRL